MIEVQALRQAAALTSSLWAAGIRNRLLIARLAYAGIGFTVPQQTQAIWAAFTHLTDRAALQPGDLLLYSSNGAANGIHHVGIYVNGRTRAGRLIATVLAATVVMGMAACSTPAGTLVRHLGELVRRGRHLHLAEEPLGLGGLQATKKGFPLLLRAPEYWFGGHRTSRQSRRRRRRPRQRIRRLHFLQPQ